MVSMAIYHPRTEERKAVRWEDEIAVGMDSKACFLT